VNSEYADTSNLDILLCVAWNPVSDAPVVIYREERLNLLTSVEFSAVCSTITDLALEIAPFGIPDILDMNEDETDND